MRHEHGDRDIIERVARGAAQHEFANAGVAIGAHDEDAGVEFAGASDDDIGCVAAVRRPGLHLGFHTLTMKAFYHVVAERHRMRWLSLRRIDPDQADVVCPDQKRERFVKGAGGFLGTIVAARDEFAAHWTDRHGPIAERHHPGIARYVQNIVRRTLTPGAPEWDGIAELHFVQTSDFTERMYDSPAGRDIVREDVLRFIDPSRGERFLLGRWTIVRDHPSRD